MCSSQKDEDVSKSTVILEIDKLHFTVRLYEDMLRIDLKGSFKNKVEEAFENKPILKETIGGILSIFAPLHIRLSSIKLVHMDKTGEVKVKLPYHQDVVIPLEPKEAEELVNKLNQLIPKAKRKDWQSILRKRTRHLKRRSKRVPPSSYVTLPYYFPAEQVDIVKKLKRKKKRRKK